MDEMKLDLQYVKLRHVKVRDTGTHGSQRCATRSPYGTA